MDQKKEIDKEILQPKESTLKFLKGYSAQFSHIHSKELGFVLFSNN